jgi:hypothetical protein
MTVQQKQKQKRGDVIRHVLFDPATQEARWRHCRQYYAPDENHLEPWKRVWWESLEDGRWVMGLNGLASSSLPLWNAHLLRTYAPNLDVILCEGEKAAQALKAAGHFAVATVCGAEVCPDRDVLQVLASRRVLIWRDHDTPGVRHMREIAGELADGIASAVRWIDWKQAPPSSDAADFIDRRGASALRDLLSEALIEEPPFTAPEGEQAPRYAGAPARADTPGPIPHVEVWPDPLADAAYYGPMGTLVRAIAPESEADPTAILGALIVALGTFIGPSPYYLVNDTRHGLRFYMALVGRTAIGRKGMARDHAIATVDQLAEGRAPLRYLAALSTGEGLIYRVRDPVPAQSDKEKDDPGETDKRLLVVDNEFARTLRAASRKENTLAAIVTDAFDGKPLEVPTRKAALKASVHHIGLLVQTQREALARELSTADIVSGFVNRFLWFLVKRAQYLPDGGRPLLDIPGVSALLDDMARAVAFARSVGRMHRDQTAGQAWRTAYMTQLSTERPGLFGDVTNRAEALALRLQMLYALLDGTDTIGESHVQAALAVVDYSLRSCEILFGGRTGSSIADRLLRVLTTAGERGLTGTEIFSQVFGRNVPATEIAQALRLLEETGRVYSTHTKTGGPGRPGVRWFARTPGN